MSSEPKLFGGDNSAAQQQFLSLFLRNEREVFRYVAALVPNVADGPAAQPRVFEMEDTGDTLRISKEFTGAEP